MIKKLAFLSPTLLFMAMSVNAAAETVDTYTLSWLEGRAQFSVTEANSNLSILSGDGMQPVYEDERGFVYGDLMADYASDATYLMSPGMGYRGIFDNQILGAYAFADYEKTNLGANFWVLSPGVEWISTKWDAHINGYFPTQSAQQVGGSEDASNFDLYGNQYQTYTDGSNIVSEAMFAPYAVLGNGVDAEVGYSFSQEEDLRSRLYLGGYYYHPEASDDLSNVMGGTLGFEKPMNDYVSVSLFNSYDNVNHYVFGIKLTATFGGESNHYSSSVEDRLFDPVQRHIGIVDTGAGAYDQQTLQKSGDDDYYVYFGSPDGDGNGSYNHPGPVDQASLDATYAASPEGARIYIQGGEDATYNTNELSAYDGQDFYGRTSDYMESAPTNERPDIIFAEGSNGFIVRGGENTFSDLNISSLGDNHINTAGIYASNVDSGDETLTINNTTVSGFVTGVYVVNANTVHAESGDFILNVTNSQFNDNTSSDYSASGMEVWNTGSGNAIINITNSEFNNNNSVSSASGLYVVNDGSGDMTLNITHSEFNHNSSVGDAGYTWGMYVSNSNTGTLTAYVDQSTFNDNTAHSDGSAYGVNLINASTKEFLFSATHSEFNNNMAGTEGDGVGLIAYNSNGNLIISATNSKFNNNSLDGMSINNQSSTENSLQVTDLSGSTFNHNGVYGIYDATTPPDSATSINIAGATFKQNGFDDYNWSL